VATKVLTLSTNSNSFCIEAPPTSGAAAGAPRNRTAIRLAPDGRSDALLVAPGYFFAGALGAK